MAKTQYSFSHDANLLGAPSGFEVPIREFRLNSGAGFVVAVLGEIMTMPGLRSVPLLQIWIWMKMGTFSACLGEKETMQVLKRNLDNTEFVSIVKNDLWTLARLCTKVAA